MIRGEFGDQSIEQLLIREEHPEFACVEARVLDEARQTLLALAKGERPTTVLGGLMMTGHWSSPGALEDEPRSVSEIAGLARIDPHGLNNRGDTIRDVLADLLEVGWVEQVGPSVDSVDALLHEHPTIEEFKMTDAALVATSV